MPASDITFDFSGRVAIVTGVGSAIGRAIAPELGRSGAAVVVSDLKQEVADRVVAEIEDATGKALGVAGDVADPANADALVQAAGRLPGTLPMAVNNAGIGGPHADARDYPLDGWKRVIDINLNGVLYGIRAQLARMAAAGTKGSIVNMASILGSVGFAGSSAYVAAKDEAVLHGLAERHATGRLGTPGEGAALTLFQLSDRASFITGSYHLVDGGYTAA